MVAIVKVTGSGQITIPAAMRRKHNIEQGDRILVAENENGQLTICRTRSVEELKGSVPALDRHVDDDFGNTIREAMDEEAARIVAEMNGDNEAE